MLMAITDPEAFAILLTILVATASAGRAVIFATETSRPFLLRRNKDKPVMLPQTKLFDENFWNTFWHVLGGMFSPSGWASLIAVFLLIMVIKFVTPSKSRCRKR